MDASVSHPLTRKWVLGQTWPIMLANAAAPVVGFVDTLIIGRFAGTLALAGIGLGAVVYAIVYWGFGFLRMSTAGLAAQADGAGDDRAVAAHLGRAVPLGMAIGTLVLVTQIVLIPAIFGLYTATAEIEGAAEVYIRARLWGLPATLGSIALMGWFVGLGRSRAALWMQVVLNAVNLPLSLLFVAGMDLGLAGVGWASSVAEWCGLTAGTWLARRELRMRGARVRIAAGELLARSALRKLGALNGDIFIRTLALTFGFNWFANAAAGEGEVFLAGNQILMQYITLIALVLDGFAHTAEAAVGQAMGAGSRARFDRGVRLTGEFSVGFAVLLGAMVLVLGPVGIDLVTTDPEVRASAKAFLPFCALTPVLGFAAWWLDGIFIGATATRAMRNAGLVAVAIYLGLHTVLEPRFGPYGIWGAFLAYYVARAVTLGVAFPGLRARV